MILTINGEKKDIPREVNLRELLEYLQLPQERIAVEHNKTVVRKKNWETVKVSDGDQLEIIHFVGGG